MFIMTRICCECKKPLGEEFEWLNKPGWDNHKFICPECRTRRIIEIKKRKSKSKQNKEVK
mgnify:CR=1 FL=1